MQESRTQESKTVVSQKSNLKGRVLLLVGLLIFIFGSVNYHRIRVLSFSKVPKTTAASIENTDIPVELMIPSLKMDIIVDPGNINDGVWAISANNATFLTISSPPGSMGNTVIYGHNKKSIFGDLPYVSIGQKIIVKTASGKIYKYEVDKKYFVAPDRVDLVSPTDGTELTIYTCWGLFDSQRAVIKARLLP